MMERTQHKRTRQNTLAAVCDQGARAAGGLTHLPWTGPGARTHYPPGPAFLAFPAAWRCTRDPRQLDNGSLGPGHTRDTGRRGRPATARPISPPCCRRRAGFDSRRGTFVRRRRVRVTHHGRGLYSLSLPILPDDNRPDLFERSRPAARFCAKHLAWPRRRNSAPCGVQSRSRLAISPGLFCHSHRSVSCLRP
jgi:hypothetical protein